MRGVEADATRRRARGRAIRLRAPRCGVSDARDGAAGNSVARQSPRSRRDLFLVWAGILLGSSVEPSTALADGDEGGDPETVQPGTVAFEPQVRNSDIAVFIAGVIPFVWAHAVQVAVRLSSCQFTPSQALIGVGEPKNSSGVPTG